jgi:protein arginine N-methyltransferase 1
MSVASLAIHGQMLADSYRNARLRQAIELSVRPGDIVADVGAGSGLLAMFAVRAGAAKVYAIEATSLAGLAQALVRDNGMDDQIVVIPGLSQETVLPERCDVVISETLGFLGLDEGFQSIMADARDRFLKPGGILLPRAVELWAAAVEQPPQCARLVATGEIEGLNLRRATNVFSRVPLRAYVESSRHISAREQLFRLDCAIMQPGGELPFSVRLASTRSADLAGFCVWFKAELFHGVELSSESPAYSNHWAQAYLPASDPKQLAEGDVAHLTGRMSSDRRGSRIEWSCDYLAHTEPAVAL